MITEDFLKKVVPLSTKANRDKYIDYLNTYMKMYHIESDNEIASYIANIAHESQNFSRVKENLNYSSERLMVVFKKYFPTKDIADRYAHKPEAIGNRVYANRMGNGDEKSGDGSRFCGRGLIMSTGKSEYESLSKIIGEDFIKYPDLLATPKYAVWSSCIFWDKKKLNSIV